MKFYSSASFFWNSIAVNISPLRVIPLHPLHRTISFHWFIPLYVFVFIVVSTVWLNPTDIRIWSDLNWIVSGHPLQRYVIFFPRVYFWHIVSFFVAIWNFLVPHFIIIFLPVNQVSHPFFYLFASVWDVLHESFTFFSFFTTIFHLLFLHFHRPIFTLWGHPLSYAVDWIVPGKFSVPRILSISW